MKHPVRLLQPMAATRHRSDVGNKSSPGVINKDPAIWSRCRFIFYLERGRGGTAGVIGAVLRL